MDINTVAIISARGNSKGIPGKNAKLLNGIPLLAYTIDAAYGCDKIDLVVFSSEDENLQSLFMKYANNYDPDDKRTFLVNRPAYLSQDHVQVEEVVTHAIRVLEISDIHCQTVVVLQPTSPLRTYQHIYEALVMWDGESTLMTGCAVGGYYWKWDHESGETIPLAHNPDRRQGRQFDYHGYGIVKENGALYVMPALNVSLWGRVRKDPFQFMLMDESDSVDLDTPKDWNLANKIMSESGWINLPSLGE